MRPSEVRDSILRDHDQIRELLATVDDLAAAVVRGGCDALPLRRSASRLYELLQGHLDFEDEHLIPAIRDADAWGEERARQLQEEHREQRELLSYVLGQIEDREHAPKLLGQTLKGFVAAMIEDMDHEENAIVNEEILRDDVVGIDVEAG